jgi:SnoaL-like domain
MPWIPELFTAPAAAQIMEKARRERLTAIAFFDGVLSGDTDALTGSFAGEPELHHPTRGRIKGTRAFERFVTDQRDWLASRNAKPEHVDVLVTPNRTIEEVVLHLDGDSGPVVVPIAITADRNDNARLLELRVYFSTWPLNGRHAIRPPLLQPDPEVHEADIVGDYQRALAIGDVDATVACFEPDGYVREPAGGNYVHRGTAAQRALFTSFFSNGGGIPLEHSTATDDGRACALEYNVVQWGRTAMPPEAGIAIYVRGDSGKLAAARIYDDSNPPLTAHS